MQFISLNARGPGLRHARLAAGVAAVALMLGACAAHASATGHSVSHWRRGAVVSVTDVVSFSAPKLAAGLTSLGLGSWSALVHYGVDGYRVIYRTIAVDGRPTTARRPRARPATARIPGLLRHTFTSSALPPRTFTDSPGNCGSRR
jgi:hypothetical protein